MNAGIDLALASGRCRASPQNRHQTHARIPGSREARRYSTRHLRSSSCSWRTRPTAVSGTMVSASTKQRTRAELAAAPALRAAAQVRPAHGTRRTPTSLANLPTIAAVASSLPSSATITSNALSGSQSRSRGTPEARDTLASIASSTSPISASSFRAGITTERRGSVIALETPAGDHERAARQHGSLPPPPDPEARPRRLPLQGLRGEETPGTHGELRPARDVAKHLRQVECDDRPEELPAPVPGVTHATGVERLHDDDGSPRDARRFCEHCTRVVGVREHEDEQRGRERPLRERQHSI